MIQKNSHNHSDTFARQNVEHVFIQFKFEFLNYKIITFCFFLPFDFFRFHLGFFFVGFNVQLDGAESPVTKSTLNQLKIPKYHQCHSCDSAVEAA